LSVVLILVSFLAGASATGPGNLTRHENVLRVVAIEWIPLYAHKQVLEALETGLREAGNPEFEIESVCAYGDDGELARQLDALSKSPPAILLSFGNYVTERVADTVRDVPVLALLVRDATGLIEKASGEMRRLAVIDSDPDPKLVWQLARELAPGADTLGVLHTDRFEPNVALVRALSEEARLHGGTVRSATVGAGFCRTDSDFQRGLDRIPDSQEIDLLYVPDDPNCSRFGTQVYRHADEKGWPAIGSEATIGKGCVAAVAVDYDATGKRAARICRDVLDGSSPSATFFPVPGKVYVDPKRLSAHSMSMSPWLLDNSDPFD
jgi:ABC-type uncharacterized transport system substrate-binding protein